METEGSLNSVVFGGIGCGSLSVSEDGGLSFLLDSWRYKYEGEDCTREKEDPGVEVLVFVPADFKWLEMVQKKFREGCVMTVVGKIGSSGGGCHIEAEHVQFALSEDW
jgi:hypothetical protein